MLQGFPLSTVLHKAGPLPGLAHGLTSHADSFNDVHRFDPSQSTWTSLPAPMESAPLPRGSTGFAAAGGQLYLFGGKTEENGRSNLRPPAFAFATNHYTEQLHYPCIFDRSFCTFTLIPLLSIYISMYPKKGHLIVVTNNILTSIIFFFLCHSKKYHSKK